MAGTVKIDNLQLGDSLTATNNFVLKTNADGTAKLARGNVGATTQDILTVGADGKVTSEQVYMPAGTGAVAATVQSKLRESVSVFDFMTAAQISDAKGETSTGTDHTTAIQAAIDSDASSIFFPAGTYRTGTLTISKKVRFVGEGNWGYAGYSDYSVAAPSYTGRVSILTNNGSANIPVFSGTAGCDIDTMVVRSTGVPTSSRKLFDVPPSHIHLINVLFEGLAGLGSNNSSSWGGWKMTDCQVSANQGDVFYGVIVDMVVTNNTFTSCTGHILNMKTGSGLNIFSNNRCEYTSQSHVYGYRSRMNVISNNIFDRAYAAAVNLAECSQHSISSNLFWRNGYTNSGTSDSHILIENCSEAISIVGNTFKAGTNDGGGGAVTPAHLLRLTNQSVVVNWNSNVDDGGCADTPFVDTYGTSQKCIFADKVRVPTTNANTASDPLFLWLNSLNTVCVAGVKAIIGENRKLTNYGGGGPVIWNYTTSPVTIDASSGSYVSLKHNVIFGTVTYTMSGSIQYASSKPNGYQQNGRLPVGTVFYPTSPASGQPAGWVVTVSGTPDTILNMANLS